VIALGYKGEYIKKYFVDYCSLDGNIEIDFKNGRVDGKRANNLEWVVNLIETGIQTNTGGRIKRLKPYLGKETFMLTWGDGVSNVNLADLLAFHRAHGKIATLTAVRPPARYGHLELDGQRVTNFSEKPQTAEGWINGAFFVLEPKVFDFIEGDYTQFEKEPLEQLASEGQLMAYQHEAFWQCMDTLREKHILQEMWESGHAPWKTWG
jgi:glucose-1-phosphate cytidylyltransferase